MENKSSELLNYLSLNIKILDDKELSEKILNEILDLIKKNNSKYELIEKYTEYKSIKNIVKEIYSTSLKINNISIKTELQKLLDLLLKTYSSKKLIYILYINDNDKLSSVRINKKGEKITTKNHKRLIGISF